jgi:hypothetical protein
MMTTSAKHEWTTILSINEVEYVPKDEAETIMEHLRYCQVKLAEIAHDAEVRNGRPQYLGPQNLR